MSRANSGTLSAREVKQRADVDELIFAAWRARHLPSSKAVRQHASA